MKTIKKLMALVIALVMCIAMAIPAMAASITINPGSDATGIVSTEYTYYQLLNASIDAKKNVVYYIDGNKDTLKDLLAAVKYNHRDGDIVTPFSFTKSADGTRWNVVISDKVEASDGEALATALNTTEIKNAAITNGNFEQIGSDGTTSAFSGDVAPGYYLITSTLGSKLVLQTLNDVKIDTKNQYITNIKNASKTNMEVGDNVIYTITVNIPETIKVGEKITVHDTLDTIHLAILNNSDKIAETASDYNITATIGNDGNSVELKDSDVKTGETFAKKFTVTQDMINVGFVVLKYKAELLSTAANDTGYVNKVYSNTSAYETLPSDVKVYTFDINLNKTFTGVDDADAAKYKAIFELRKTATGDGLKFISDSTGYVLADSDDENTSADLIVTGGASINIRGLAAGTYYLVEKATADGFNLLTNPIIVTITDNTTGTQPNITPAHTVSYKAGESGGSMDGTEWIDVENNSGSTLPSTGGMGTTIFYVVGTILVLAAVVLLITKKRMHADK